MKSEHDTNFLAAINEHIFSFIETVNTTITHLAQVEQEHGTLHTYIASLLQHYGFTIQQLNNDEKSLMCGRYVTKETQTLLIFSSCPPQSTAFARWSTFVTRLLTFALYHKAIGSISLSIVWLIDTEEHSENDTAMSRFVKENETLLHADECLYDLPISASLPAQCLALGTKGLLSIDMEVRTALREHHTLHGAILPDAAWRLTWALSSLKDSREEIRIEGFYDTLIPMDDEEIAMIRTLADDEDALKQRMHVDDFLLGLHGFQLQYTHLLLPTCTVTSIHSGDASNEQHTIPSFAKASLDIHLVPEQDPEDIYTKLREHLDMQGFQDVSTTVRVSKSPQYTSLRHPFSSMVYESACVLYEKNIPLFPLMPEHSTHYPFQSLLNIPVVYTRMGYVGNQLYEHDTVMMAEDEQRQKQFLANTMRHMAMIIKSMADATSL